MLKENERWVLRRVITGRQLEWAVYPAGLLQQLLETMEQVWHSWDGGNHSKPHDVRIRAHGHLIEIEFNEVE